MSDFNKFSRVSSDLGLSAESHGMSLWTQMHLCVSMDMLNV
ncbi:hypothetical protein [Undibacterium curvum]